MSDNDERKSRITELVVKYKNKNIKKLIYKHRETQRNTDEQNQTQAQTEKQTQRNKHRQTDTKKQLAANRK